MLYIPLWRRIFIWSLVAIGILLALPNAFYSRVERSNDARAEIVTLGNTPEREADPSSAPCERREDHS